MLTTIIGSAIGFTCSLSLILAVSLLIVYKRRVKAVKTLEENTASILEAMKRGVN